MTLEEMNLEENLEMELEDKLSCLTADLVEFESNSLFLERLFSEEVGKLTSCTSTYVSCNNLS
jgi:hypothetical protein